MCMYIRPDNFFAKVFHPIWRGKEKTFIFAVPNRGRVAEWLGKGLQNLVQRFESARDLHLK